jgi:pilus assembly protein FimV
LKRNLKLSGRFALTSVAFAALCLTSPWASALGLGRLTVKSALGEAMQAEIDVTDMTPEEQANLRIRVAPPEAYRAANVDYNPVLPTTRATLQKRSDGRLFVRLVSDRGVQEPFVDVILEISWATGRLVREYTLLFDPPTAIRAAAPSSSGTTTSPVISAAPPPAEPLPPSSAAPAPAPAPAVSSKEAARQRREAARAAEAESRAAAAESKAQGTRSNGTAAGAGVDEVQVHSGDTLSKIATRTQREGVSLDQMLVALFRTNPSAFSGENMNRLKAGVVLSVPSAETAQAVNGAEARKTIVAQSADFGAYRQRLASSTLPAQTEPSARQSTGKVQGAAEDRKTATAPTPDKLTLSKGGAPGAAATSEDKLSKERERQAADARVAELNKNLNDLKKIQGATPGAPAPAPAPAPAVPPPVAGAKPAATPPPVVVAAAPPPPVVVPVPAPITTPAVPTPAPAVVPPATMAASTATPATPASVPAVVGVPPAVIAGSGGASAAAPVVAQASAAVVPRPAPRPAGRQPAPPPGLLDSLLSEPLYLGLGALVVLLAGYGGYRFMQRSKKDSGETSFLESRLQPDSFFGASGGQRIDTRDAAGSSSSMTYSLSQLDAIGDVDPVAEADVYLAYGRDLQAEEILKEAMRSNPERLAIRTKLLEVYAKRRDIKGFELLATQLFALTRGEGEEWSKTQELGAQIDPDNSLYHAGGAPERHDDGGTIVEPLGASTLPQSVVPVPSQYGMSVSDVTLRDSQIDVDFDLDNPEIGVPSGPVPFDATESVPPRGGPTYQSTTLKMPLTPNEASPGPDHRDEPLAFDLSGIALDLDKPAAGTTTAGAAASSRAAIEAPFVDDDSDDPVSRKMELAEEFQRIGDKDGARDLLREVLTTASGSTKTKAQAMLDDLG